MAKAKPVSKKAANPLRTGTCKNPDNAAKIVTPAFIGSYVTLLEPKADKKGVQKYSISMIFDKDSTDFTLIEEGIAAAAKAKFGDKLPKNFKHPLRDGDDDRDGEEYQNSMFMNASTTRRPQIIDLATKKLVTCDDEDIGVYSGCTLRASITFFGFDKEGNRGVGCGLNNVQVLKRGDRIDGGTSAATDFGDDDEDELDLDNL